MTGRAWAERLGGAVAILSALLRARTAAIFPTWKKSGPRWNLPAEVRDRAVFVLVSFDVARDTPAVLAQYRVQHGLDAQWVLLHGSDGSVRELAALLGVKYKQEADGAFSPSNIVTILNREGEIVHQRQGLKGGLDEAVTALVAMGR